MHGCLKMSIKTDAMNISSVWTDLSNPDLDPNQVEGGENGIAGHPSERMRLLGSADGRSEEGWASVRIDGRDWGKVMSVGRLGGRVIACKQATIPMQPPNTNVHQAFVTNMLSFSTCTYPTSTAKKSLY
jgi:hypothetical protein